ncbi:hypothetical protein M2152_002064 [Microbacteriaceae bacterium SG_E_30_P1]|uniref:DUF4012 domain-containing protein n=1 Tax=Antiquaquibacter oligotrophicus TaxID=2880260 RepID=A0ABT6KPF6_9MICO|nr:DUF4012 domain-containing protein [Antiquaquibacter oligotrophicus]MDH6181882.1 hypothetical protein [Antiquaquibacter oligotrophicus]UDF12443.1 DUF4012 domain-containing protein [Antiquaquibacter oligotrophicus]
MSDETTNEPEALETRASRRTRERPKRRLVWPWVLAGIAVLVLAAVAWVGVRGWLARGELEAAVPLASRIQQQVVKGEADAAAQSLAQLQRHAASARSLTGDPVWRTVEIVPFAGANLRLVRELTESVDELAREGIAPLTQLAGTVDPASLRPVDGVIDVQPLVDAAPRVAEAAEAITAVQARVHSIRRDDTIPLLRDAADELQTSLDEVALAMQSLDGALTLLPTMLGADGPRNYLVLFQNPAELRSGGGIPGAMALIATDGGRMDLVQQATTHDFQTFPSPVLELPVATRSLYGDITGEYILDVTLAPQFEISGALAREMWKQQFGVEVDGVVAVDPIALSYLLEATGPITLSTGDELSADNAVDLLLSEVYWRYPSPVEQDVFFASAAVAVFDALKSGSVNPSRMIDAFAAAGADRRVLMWFPDDAMQQVIAGTTLAGELPPSDAETTRFGMYFNDATGSKMDYYLDREITIASAQCRGDGRRTVDVDVTLTNTAENDQLPTHVTGGGSFGVKPGDVHTMVALYAPPGSINQGVSSVDSAGATESIGALQTLDEDYVVSQVTVELAPQESKTVRFRMLLEPGMSANLDILATPGIYQPETYESSLLC